MAQLERIASVKTNKLLKWGISPIVFRQLLSHFSQVLQSLLQQIYR